MTKDQVLALPAATADEYVAEQVMQWARAASVVVTGGLSIENGWVENAGSSDVIRRDGSPVSAPNYRLLPVVQTPAFDGADWPQRIIAKMLERGFRFQAQRVGAEVLAAFHAPAATPAEVEAAACGSASAGDAVRRAALFAVQA